MVHERERSASQGLQADAKDRDMSKVLGGSATNGGQAGQKISQAWIEESPPGVKMKRSHEWGP